MAALSPYARALLNTIAGTESPGYNVMYGGGRFNDYSHHPDQAVRIQTGPNAGRTSSAAGRYQFLNSTWQDEANKLGLKDFSPDSQDQAAWDLASSTYKAKTGQDLNSVLASGDRASLAGVGNALASQWTSLPGGIEQGQNQHQFADAFQKNMYAGMADGPKGQEAYAPPAPFGSMAPPPTGMSPSDNSIDPNVAKYAFDDQKNPIGNRLSKAGDAFSKALQAPRIRTGPFPGGPSAEQSGGLLKAAGGVQQLAQMLMQRRVS